MSARGADARNQTSALDRNFRPAEFVCLDSL